jgi:hypothetical protein
MIVAPMIRGVVLKRVHTFTCTHVKQTTAAASVQDTIIGKVISNTAVACQINITRLGLCGAY